MVLLEKRKERVHLEEIEVGGRIILNCLIKFDWQVVKSNGLSQDTVNCWAFVITVLNIWFHKGGGGEFFTFWESKLSKGSAPDYSVHKYIYRSCMSGPSNITLL